MGIVQRFTDGLVNALTGAGSTSDPRSYNRYFARSLTPMEIDQAFRGSWVCRKIVEKPAEEMVREWRDWQADADQIALLEAEEKRLDVRNKVRRAEVLRGLGGAGMVLWIEGDDQTTPLDPKRIRQRGLTAIHVWHQTRFGLGPMVEDWNDPWFGFPSYYQLTLQGTGLQTFHPSRVIAFRGKPIPDIVGSAWNVWFWGESTVQVVMDAVQNVDASQNGFAALIKDARNRRLSVPGLTNMVSTAPGEAIFSKRVAAMATGESMYGVTFLDAGGPDGKGGETLEDRQMNWAGIPDIAAMYMAAAAAAADMPATVLLGKSPDGMNATGAGDLANWHATVKARQDLDLRPCLTQLDAALIPSALGKPDPAVWYEFAPLSTLSEKDEAATFLSTMQAMTALQTSAAIPDVAFSKGMQNLVTERGWVPGLDAALAEIPEGERFPSDIAGEYDPNEAEGGDQTSAGEAGAIGSVPVRRAANDTRFNDAAPKSLYVQRKLLNTADFIAWAKREGFDTTTPADELHVTITYSRQALDWMKIGQDWSSDKEGKLTVNAGGPRIVQTLGDKGAAVLLFASNDLTWRHQAICEAGASFDFDEYQPHVTITYQAPADLDLSKVKPYTGPLVFGPELFSEINEDWSSSITEE